MNSLFGNSGGFNSIIAEHLKKQPRLEIYEDSKDPKAKIRWRIWMSSDIVAASSQGYATEAAAKENIKKIRDHINELEKLGKL
ncbi:YegP family protein [Ferruginibacter sp.]|nr:hypothetical protein [Ferruginibacter sp.]